MVRPAQRFVAVGSADAVRDGEVRPFTVEDREIIVANLGGELRAYGNRCPHQGGRMTRARLERGELVCPWHQWRFDARTGRARWPEGYERLASFPVKVEGGQVLVGVE